MTEFLRKLSRLSGRDSVIFGAFDPTPLLGGAHYEFAPTVAEYFHTSVPSSRLDLGLYRIFSAEDIDSENRDNIPSYYCAPLGFVTIATDSSGDAFSVDLTDGRVYLLSHEKYETDGIHPGWNADCTALLPPIPVTRQNIIETSEGYWESTAEFLNECLEYATENL